MFQLFWASVIESGSWKQKKLLKSCASCSLQSRCWAEAVCRLGSLLIQNTTESGNPMPVTPPALESTHVTCKQIATLTLDPKVVLTARGDRPMSLKSLEKEWVRETRGRSSATTTQVRTQDRLIPRACQNHKWVQRTVCVNYLCHTAPRSGPSQEVTFAFYPWKLLGKCRTNPVLLFKLFPLFTFCVQF